MYDEARVVLEALASPAEPATEPRVTTVETLDPLQTAQILGTPVNLGLEGDDSRPLSASGQVDGKTLKTSGGSEPVAEPLRREAR